MASLFSASKKGGLLEGGGGLREITVQFKVNKVKIQFPDLNILFDRHACFCELCYSQVSSHSSPKITFFTEKESISI